MCNCVMLTRSFKGSSWNCQTYLHRQTNYRKLWPRGFISHVWFTNPVLNSAMKRSAAINTCSMDSWHFLPSQPGGSEVRAQDNLVHKSSTSPFVERFFYWSPVTGQSMVWKSFSNCINAIWKLFEILLRPMVSKWFKIDVKACLDNCPTIFKVSTNQSSL